MRTRAKFRERLMWSDNECTERLQLLSVGNEAGRTGAWHFDVRKNRLTCSDGLLSLLGIDRKHFSGTDEAVDAFTHPDDIERRRNDRTQDFADGGWFEHDYRIVRPDGELRWMCSRGNYMRHADGTAAEAYGVMLDITERKQAEDRQRLLFSELRHRVRNTLAQMMVIIERSCASAASVDAVAAALTGRLGAMARGHARLGGGHLAKLRELVEEELAPYESQTSTIVEGPNVAIIPDASQALGMVFHELATNAAKYGALSTTEGRVAVRWRLTAENGSAQLSVVWHEEGGPTVVAPKREGFGTRLIQNLLRHDLGGHVELSFPPSGARCEFEIPLASATEAGAAHGRRGSEGDHPRDRIPAA
jgi:PAS domain S-box-containing protein